MNKKRDKHAAPDGKVTPANGLREPQQRRRAFIDEGRSGFWLVLENADGEIRHQKRYSTISKLLDRLSAPLDILEPHLLDIFIEAGFFSNYGRPHNSGDFRRFCETCWSHGWRIFTIQLSLARPVDGCACTGKSLARKWASAARIWDGNEKTWDDKIAANALRWGRDHEPTVWRLFDSFTSLEAKRWMQERVDILIDAARSDKAQWSVFCEKANRILKQQVLPSAFEFRASDPTDKDGRLEIERLREALGDSVCDTNGAVAVAAIAAATTNDQSEYMTLLAPHGSGYRSAFRGWFAQWASGEKHLQWAARCLGWKYSTRREELRSLLVETFPDGPMADRIAVL